jgi:hypothetical protein
MLEPEQPTQPRWVKLLRVCGPVTDPGEDRLEMPAIAGHAAGMTWTWHHRNDMGPSRAFTKARWGPVQVAGLQGPEGLSASQNRCGLT